MVVPGTCFLRTRLKLLITLALISFAASLPVYAQSFRGSLVGTVLDQSGAAVPAITVAAVNQATGVSRSTTTDTSGNYSIPELPIGNYTISVRVEGFTPVTQTDIHVDVAAERRVDITLDPAKQRQSMEVRAEVPMVTTTEDTLGGTIESTQVENLPVNGRDYTKLIYLQPRRDRRSRPDHGFSRLVRGVLRERRARTFQQLPARRHRHERRLPQRSRHQPGGSLWHPGDDPAGGCGGRTRRALQLRSRIWPERRRR